MRSRQPSRHPIDAAARQVLQFNFKAGEIQQVDTWLKIYKQVDIARRIVVPRATLSNSRTLEKRSERASASN